MPAGCVFDPPSSWFRIARSLRGEMTKSQNMKIYCVREILRDNGEIHGSHRWGLPGVTCPVCHETWAGSGLEYPSIDLSELPEEALFREARRESLKEYLRLKDMITKAFPSIKKLKPGTSFGPLVGRTIGEISGFVWNLPWTVTLTGEALRGLKSRKLSLPVGVPPILEANNKSPELFELELLPYGKLLNGIYPPGLGFCYACGRDAATMPQRLVVEYSSIPQEIDLFRLSNFTTLILATERFVESVGALNIEGAFFEVVDLV